MGKQFREDDLESRIYKRLDQSDELTKDLTTAIEGDPKRGIPGFVPTMNKALDQIETNSSRITTIERWVTNQEINRGTFSLKWSNLGSMIIKGVGVLTLTATFLTAASAFVDWLHKKGWISLLLTVVNG